jgi:hypothetical protein
MLGPESSGAQHLGHVPQRFVKLQILIDTFDCSALRHLATIGTAAASVSLSPFRDVLLNLCGASCYVERPGNTASIAH